MPIRNYDIYTIAYSPTKTAVLFFIGIALIVSGHTFCRRKIKKIEQEISSDNTKTHEELQKLRGKRKFFERWQCIGWVLVVLAALNLYKLIRYGF
jgi:ABC-type Fe3+ transport system permease subunit